MPRTKLTDEELTFVIQTLGSLKLSQLKDEDQAAMLWSAHQVLCNQLAEIRGISLADLLE